MKVFEIKSCNDLTWEDIPFIEAPVFAQYHIMDMLMDPRQLWMRIQRLQEFVAKEIGVYRPLENHDAVKDRINYLIGSGIYFNVSLVGKPFRPAFDWKSDDAHPHKGFWADIHNFYWMSPTIVKRHLDRIAREWHTKQTMAFTEELLQSPFALAQEKVEEYFSVARSKPDPVVPAKTIPEEVFAKKEIKPTLPDAIKSKSLSGSPYEDDYDQIIWQASKDYGVPPEILKAKIRKESTFNNEARNTNNVDGSTTVGLGQFTEWAAINMGLEVDLENGIDERMEPSKTIPAQAKYLKELYDEFSGVALNEADGWRFALASYNLGPAKVNEQITRAETHMKNGKIAYNDPSMIFHKGTYTPKIMGLSGDVGGWADEYSSDFDKYR